MTKPTTNDADPQRPPLSDDSLHCALAAGCAAMYLAARHGAQRIAPHVGAAPAPPDRARQLSAAVATCWALVRGRGAKRRVPHVGEQPFEKAAAVAAAIARKRRAAGTTTTEAESETE